MARQSRRQFLHRGAGAVAALGAGAAIGAPRSGAAADPAAVRALAATLDGHLITPESPDYDWARQVFNRAFDRRPALIAYGASASDVARVVEFSRRYRLPLAIRSGGHSRAGFSVCDDGVVLDLSLMSSVTVDATRRMARVAGGARVVSLDAATQAAGLATPSAGCPAVGVAGLTLGGGEGLLMSKYGAACDNLLSARLVTVDGQQITASRERNPDLFWAIRGGGGNFGVVTDLEFQLHPLSDVLAGTLVYPNGRIAEHLETFSAFVAAAPDEMNVVGQVVNAGDGTHFRMLVCHCGEPRAGHALLAPLRARGPRLDEIRPMPYLQANATLNPAAPAAHFQTNLFLPALGAAAIERIAAAVREAPPGTRDFIVPFYGAITRVPLDETAFALRSFGYELDLMGRWTTPAERTRAEEWVAGLRDALKPLATGVYVNQLGETSEPLVRDAYRTHYERLAAIKRQYDPGNVLRLNQNIVPAAAASRAPLD